MGQTEAARERLHVALGALPARPSPDRIRLRLALALTSLMSGDLQEASGQAADARDDARAIGDPVFEAAALALGALAGVSAGGGPTRRSSWPRPRSSGSAASSWRRGCRRSGCSAARGGRSGSSSLRWHGLERGAALAAQTGRENVRPQLTVESVATLIELGRTADASAAAEQGVELARLTGNPRMLLWARCALSSARLAAGDVSAALDLAGEAAESGVRADFHAAGEPGWSLGAALVAAGNPERAVAAMLASFGGEDLPEVLPVDRPAAAAALADAQLACGDAGAAERVLERGRDGLAVGTSGDRHRPRRGAARPVAPGRGRGCGGRGAGGRAGAPLARARAQLAEGRALAAAGRRREAVAALVAAESSFDGFGALRRRDEAVRELRNSATVCGGPLARRWPARSPR